MKTTFPLIALRVLTATAVGTLLTASARAQVPAPANPATPAAAPAATPAPKPLSPVEKNFIKNTGKSLYYLIQLVGAGKHPAVTDEKLVAFRGKVTTDLNKTWEGLKTLAAARGEALTGELVGADKTSVEKLAKMKEDKFLKEWLEEMTKEAKKLEKDFESAGRTLQDPEFKMFAANYTPMVRMVFSSVESQEKGLKKK